MEGVGIGRREGDRLGRHMSRLTPDHQIAEPVWHNEPFLTLSLSHGTLRLRTQKQKLPTQKQVTGRKRVVLYPPQDLEFLYLVGDKSAVLDIDKPDLQQFPLFRCVSRVKGLGFRV